MRMAWPDGRDARSLNHGPKPSHDLHATIYPAGTTAPDAQNPPEFSSLPRAKKGDAPDQIRTGDLRLERPTPVSADRLHEPGSARSSAEGTGEGTEISLEFRLLFPAEARLARKTGRDASRGACDLSQQRPLPDSRHAGLVRHQRFRHESALHERPTRIMEEATWGRHGLSVPREDRRRCGGSWSL
jgi:hypothetical protein